MSMDEVTCFSCSLPAVLSMDGWMDGYMCVRCVIVQMYQDSLYRIELNYTLKLTEKSTAL